MNEPVAAVRSRRATRAEASSQPRHRASPTTPATPSADAVSERIVLIEFLWAGSAGEQPVVYLDRSYLH